MGQFACCALVLVLWPISELHETRIAAKPPLAWFSSLFAHALHFSQAVELVIKSPVHVHWFRPGSQAFVLYECETLCRLMIVDHVSSGPAFDGSIIDVHDLQPSAIIGCYGMDVVPGALFRPPAVEHSRGISDRSGVM